MTKDYFCASEGSFTNNYTMVLARNILGQTSLIMGWPGFNAALGQTVPLRITINQTPLRDVQATMKAADMLVVPLGWDDEALAKIADAKQIDFTTAKTTLRYNIKDTSKAFTRLNSCTASLIDRLPDSTGLSSEVGRTLKNSGLGHAKILQVSGLKEDEAENFIVDGVFGGAALLSGKGDVSQRMLEYIDQLELLCKARFSSELGAPVPISGGEVTTAEAKCDSAQTGTTTALTFVKNGDTARVYYFESDKNHAQQVKTLRDRLAKSQK